MNSTTDTAIQINAEELQNLIQTDYSFRTVIIISGRAAARYHWEPVLQSLQTSGEVIWISEIDANPTQCSILNALKQIKDYDFEHILTIGGGSAIDLAKGILAMYPLYKDSFTSPTTLDEQDDSVFLSAFTDSIKNHTYTIPEGKDIIAIPTTAGTGSEITAWATIWDYQHTAKFSVSDPALTPAKIYLVPELTLTLPVKITLATGLDAICHAMEAYWAKATNPNAKELSIRAVTDIAKYLPCVLKEPDNLDFRTKMLYASYTAGRAFAQTKTTACHSISYPLTYMFHIEHGYAAALTLAQIAEINKKEAQDIELLLDIFKSYNGLEAWISSVTEGIVTLRLANFGITEQDLPVIAENSFTEGRMNNNPVNLTKEDIIQLLSNIL